MKLFFVKRPFPKIGRPTRLKIIDGVAKFLRNCIIKTADMLFSNYLILAEMIMIPG